MPDVYSAYKPLRNFLRSANLIDGLTAVWWYVSALQHPEPPPVPASLEVNPVFYRKGRASFPPWYLAVLARELIVNAPATSLTSSRDLKVWRHMAGAVNRLHDIDNHISREFVTQENVYHIFSKVTSHQQLAWQEDRPNSHTMRRYYYIFRHPTIRPIFERVFGMSVDRHFLLGLSTWLMYTQYSGISYPRNLDYQGANIDVTADEYNLFLGFYSQSLDTLRDMLVRELRFDYDFFTYFHSLARYPMVLTELNGEPCHVCPVPTYLFWRVTDGLYHELRAESGFDNAIGTAFESYIGEMLHAQPYRADTHIVDADALVASRNLPKADWIIVDDDTAAFVECKAKRMTLEAKTDIEFGPPTEVQIAKLAGFVVQCYRATLDAQTRGYGELTRVRKFYPVVVTMKNWYVHGDIADRLLDEVKKAAKARGLDERIVSEMPYLAMSSHEFEFLSVLLRSHSLQEIVDPYFVDAKYNRWQFGAYLDAAFSGESARYQIFGGDLLSEMVARLRSPKS